MPASRTPVFASVRRPPVRCARTRCHSAVIRDRSNPLLFRVCEGLSFFGSAAFALLLLCWLAPGLAPETALFGWLHGFTWIALAILATYAQRRGVLPFWLAFLVVVIGGVGPFAGSAGFVVESRRRARLRAA
jgi:hypothetical protein